MVKAKNRKSSLHEIDPELHDRLLSESLKRYEDEVREYLVDQSDIAFAIARTLVDLTPSVRDGKIRIANLAKPDLSKLSENLSFPNLEHRSEEHTSELQSLMRISYAVFCLKKKKYNYQHEII